MTLAELSFSDALLKDAVVAVIGAFATALFVVIGGQWAVGSIQRQAEARTALRETFARLLVAQRRSRQASLTMAYSGSASRVQKEALAKAALSAHDNFIDEYHRLNLDVSRELWKDVRTLRGVLDDMLFYACQFKQEDCASLREDAKDARQNLEFSFRRQLRTAQLQTRREVKRTKEMPEGESPGKYCFVLLGSPEPASAERTERGAR
jgi:hypothetical protein